MVSLSCTHCSCALTLVYNMKFHYCRQCVGSDVFWSCHWLNFLATQSRNSHMVFELKVSVYVHGVLSRSCNFVRPATTKFRHLFLEHSATAGIAWDTTSPQALWVSICVLQQPLGKDECWCLHSWSSVRSPHFSDHLTSHNPCTVHCLFVSHLL